MTNNITLNSDCNNNAFFSGGGVKVTLISPCYNGAKHLHPYIEGLLSQTYTNVEYIFINDGSTDETEEIINSYKEKIEQKGWTYNYIKQENRKGQAAAINKGLEIFTGDYLCCIDSDDVLLPTYIEEMAAFLETNKEYAIVFPWTEVVEENTNKYIKAYKRDIPSHVQDTLFDEFILQKSHGENFIFYPTSMIRSKILLEIYPQRHIYEGLSGQNAQLILPIIYNHKIGYVKKILYRCIARQNSDSRLLSTQEFINKTYSWEDIYCNVLKIIPNMPDYEKAYYFAFIKNYWEKKRQNLQNKKVKLSEKIFSVRNEYLNNKNYRVIRILGLKIKIKRK